MQHPLQNRVTPFGEIVAVPDRGTMMGNRGGCIHDDKQQLRRRRWASRRWICCRLSFKGWHREVMTPGRYTELFFLDEATAFAGGHRPCAECRRADYRAFQVAWQGTGLPTEAKADAMDVVLHKERTDAQQKTVLARGMPDGVMMAQGDAAYLVKAGRLYRWSFHGYGAAIENNTPLRLLTPPAIVKVFAAGYVPALHPSSE